MLEQVLSLGYEGKKKKSYNITYVNVERRGAENGPRF